jgi:hypothetical protein
MEGRSMTVIQLVRKLLACDNLNAMVTLGEGAGPVGPITETINGFVILDPKRPEGSS